MIVSKIKLNPFAGLTETDLSFVKGINVVLGANEAGKSTVFNALDKVFFTSSKLTSSKLEKELSRFFPVGGGDTIHVDLHFIHNDENYLLSRQWGASHAAKLILPDKNIITDETNIAERLVDYLGVNPGTYKSVLMSYQAGLSQTLNNLKGDYSDTVQELGDILRSAVLETDGVSVDQFKDNIKKLYNDYFERWDHSKHYPEGGKGFKNRWKKNIGKIVSAFYDKEEIRFNLEEAQKCEDELDEINQLIAKLSQTISEKKKHIEDNKKTVEDAKKRNLLDAEMKNAKKDLDEYKKINKRWPVVESKIKEVNNEIPELEKKCEILEKERSKTALAEKGKTILDKYKRAKKKKELLDEAEKKLKSTKKLTQEELNEINKAFSGLNECKTQLTAGKLSVRFSAKKELIATVKKDVEDEIQEQFTKGESRTFEAGGRLKIENPDWALEVTSGEEDYNETLKKYEQAKHQVEVLSKKHQINTQDEAQKINKEYEKWVQEVKNSKKNLETELGGGTYEKLKSKAEEIGEIKVKRSLADVVKELTIAENDLKGKRKQVERYSEELKIFEEKYINMEELLKKLVDATASEKKIKEDYAKLAPLPEGVSDPREFIRQYEEKNKELEKAKKNKTELEIKRAGMQERLPDESVEELDKRLKDLEDNFDIVIRKGAAIRRIRDLTMELSEEMDIDTYSGLKSNVERYIALMTQNRYSQIEMEESLPSGIVHKNGVLLGYDLFSKSTCDVLGLALRLAMANHFLRDRAGVLIMDDPLVDMDPERQAKAAEALREFAKEIQVIIFTCHPSHAELIGGNRVTM